MVKLDDLEAKARAMKEALSALGAYNEATPPSPDGMQRTDEFWRLAHDVGLAASALRDALEEDAHLEDTILHLIERVRAGEACFEALRLATPTEMGGYPDLFYPSVTDEEGDDPWWTWEQTFALPAIERWESLAHSPQETR